MDAGSYLHTELSGCFSGRDCATDSAGGPVEDRKETIASGIDLAAAEAVELAPNRRVVGGEQLAPAAVPERGGPLFRADDGGEKGGRGHTGPVRHRARAGEGDFERRSHCTRVPAPA